MSQSSPSSPLPPPHLLENLGPRAPLPPPLRELGRELWEKYIYFIEETFGKIWSETRDSLLDFKTSSGRKGPRVVYRTSEILYPGVFLSPWGEKNPSQADTWTEITKKKLTGLV